MTLNGRYALCCRKNTSFGACHKNFSEGRPIMSPQKCRPMSLVSGGIRFMQIFAEVPWGGGIKRQSGCREQQLSAFSLGIFACTLEMRPALLHGEMQSIVVFSAIPKCMTLNNPEWLFPVKFCFHTGLADLDHATIKQEAQLPFRNRVSAMYFFVTFSHRNDLQLHLITSEACVR